MIQPLGITCPRCGGEIMRGHGEHDNFVYCDDCVWLPPHVSEFDQGTIEVHTRKARRLLAARTYVEVTNEGRAFAEMSLDEWDSLWASQGRAPMRIGSCSWELEGANELNIWCYGGSFWSCFDGDALPQDVEVGASVWDHFVSRFERGSDSKADEDARIRHAERLAAEERRQSKLAWADAMLSGDSKKRSPIPRDTRFAVFARDGGACVECGSAFDLQYDHVIPVALGGGNSEANLQLLCGTCNRRKGSTLG